MSDIRARDDFLRQASVAVLATVDRRGRAHAAPIWYLYDDGAFVISIGRGSQKHLNVEANPEITMVVDQRTIPYYAVMACRRAEIGPLLSPDDRLRLAIRYLGENFGRRYIERTLGDDVVTIRLRPRRFIEYQGRAGRTAR